MKHRFPLRREPTQARSKRVYAAVLKAAEQTIVREGYAGLTTNHIARAANISVGSIYQYFPDKETIVAHLVDSKLESFSRELVESLAKTPGEADLRAFGERFVLARLEAQEKEAPLLREIIPHASQLGLTERLEEWMTQAIDTFLEVNEVPVRQVQRSMALRLVTQVVIYIHARMIMDPRRPYPNDRLARLLTDMMLGFLVDPEHHRLPMPRDQAIAKPS